MRCGGEQPFGRHCVQVRGHSNPAFQSWPQKRNSIFYGRRGTMLGGAANEANNRCDNNAGIVKITPSTAMPEGATALRSLRPIDMNEEILVDYGAGWQWDHRSKTTDVCQTPASSPFARGAGGSQSDGEFDA